MSTATIEPNLSYEVAEKLQRDLRTMAELLGQREVRSLVDLYNQTQHYRIQTAGQSRSSDRDEPVALIEWLRDQSHQLELNLKNALGHFSDTYYVGQWMQSICGIGPVISAGLLATLDCRGINTPCAFWSFAGVDPTKKWEKKTKRPWNAQLKTLVTFKLGECFVKVQGNKNDFYGKLFRGRRDLEEERNEALQFKDQAAAALEAKNYRKETDAYKAYSIGKLPPAHLHERARRYTIKLFLSHLHHVMYFDLNGVAPARPPIFNNPNLNSDGRHTHFIEPPNWPFASDGKPLSELYGLED